MAIIPQVVNLFFVCKYRVLIQAEQKEYIIALFTLVTTCIGHLINIVTIPIFKEMWIIRFVTMFFAVFNGVVIILYAKKQYKWISFQVDERYDLIVTEDNGGYIQFCTNNIPFNLSYGWYESC